MGEGEHDSLMLMLGKERPVLEYDVHGSEVMDITLGVVGHQFGKGTEGIDGHDGHDVLQHHFQPDGRKCIGVDDGYKRSPICRRTGAWRMRMLRDITGRPFGMGESVMGHNGLC